MFSFFDTRSLEFLEQLFHAVLFREIFKSLAIQSPLKRTGKY